MKPLLSRASAKNVVLFVVGNGVHVVLKLGTSCKQYPTGTAPTCSVKWRR